MSCEIAWQKVSRKSREVAESLSCFGHAANNQKKNLISYSKVHIICEKKISSTQSRNLIDMHELPSNRETRLCVEKRKNMDFVGLFNQRYNIQECEESCLCISWQYVSYKVTDIYIKVWCVCYIVLLVYKKSCISVWEEMEKTCPSSG